jgi:hypothetical protein
MLQEASIVGLVKIIGIILLIYYGVKILSRLFAPFLLRYVKNSTMATNDSFMSLRATIY